MASQGGCRTTLGSTSRLCMYSSRPGSGIGYGMDVELAMFFASNFKRVTALLEATPTPKGPKYIKKNAHTVQNKIFYVLYIYDREICYFIWVKRWALLEKVVCPLIAPNSRQVQTQEKRKNFPGPRPDISSCLEPSYL